MFLVRVLAACVALALPVAVHAAPPAPASAPDRLRIQSMLIEAGYSAVATLNLVHSRWVGTGAHHGIVVDFTVDAVTGRLLSEVSAP